MTEQATLKRALELAVATEELGGEYYKHMAKQFSSDAAIAEVFTRLAKDEANHEAQFKKLLAEVDGGAKTKDEESYFMVRAAALSDFFDKNAIQDPASVKTPADALSHALTFEKSTLFFYQTVRDAIGGSPQLDELIAAEKSHVTAITRVIISDARFRGIADAW